MGIIGLIIYLIFCFLVAYSAKNVAIGFWGVLALCLFLTPLLTAILVVILKPRRRSQKLNDLDYLEED